MTRVAEMKLYELSEIESTLHYEAEVLEAEALLRDWGREVQPEGRLAHEEISALESVYWR